MLEEVLMQGEQLLRSLFEYSTDAITLITSDGTIAYVNPAITHMTGYSSEEMVGSNSLTFIHPDDQGQVKDQLVRMSEEAEGSFLLEYRLCCKDGGWRWIEGTLTNLLKHPQVGAIVCNHHDITRYRQDLIGEQAERTEAEERARQYEVIFEAMTEGVAVCDREGRIKRTNAAFRRLFSLEEEYDPLLVHPEERAMCAAPRDLAGEALPQEQLPLFRILRGEHLVHQQMMGIICRNKVGQDLFLEVCGTPIRDAAGQIIGGVAVYRDITERHRLEEQLRDSQNKFRSLVDSNIVGIMETDEEGRMYKVNGQLVQWLGYSREELVNGTLRVKDLLAPGYHKVRARSWKTLKAHGSSLPEEKIYISKDGHRVPMLVVATTINQERTRALVVLLDISDRKEVERRKQEFLSMVSHELRTPLTAIQGFLELGQWCVERLSATSSVGKDNLLGRLDVMLQQAQRQTEIEVRMVGELLDVSRMEAQKFEVHLQPCDLVNVVRQAVANQQAASARRIEVTFPAQPVVAAVDAFRIEQAVTNYLTNAIKYSPSDQVVRVQLTIEGDVARVSVHDRGPGLTLEQQQHIWDSFYQAESSSDQGAASGLGLGLYIVRMIIAQHQGQVGVESCPGHGSTFWFTLPLTDEPIES